MPIDNAVCKDYAMFKVAVVVVAFPEVVGGFPEQARSKLLARNSVVSKPFFIPLADSL